MTATLETLKQLIADKFGIAPDDLDPNKPLTDFGLDSLGLIELLFDIGEHFDVNLPEDRPINNLAELAALVDEVLAGKTQR
ncbi:MAG: acyl carrier protein [Gallionellaceae bacterium]|nr:acyl carrier protein [Gallionellaceae bacterium]